MSKVEIGIPPCPKILSDISGEAGKSGPDLHRIEKLICADVGLSAALIKTVNSPFYGLRNKVHSVMQAVHLLGISHLSMMVMAMVLRDVLKGLSRIDMSRFWDASSKVAIISSYISCRLPYLSASEHRHRRIDKDKAYTFGLFHDCGIPIMLNYHATYKETLAMANKAADKKFTEIEDSEHGRNHALVGYLLARSWGLPETITQAIHFHHEHAVLAEDTGFPLNESRDFIALALLSERAIQIISGLNQTCEWPKGGKWVMEHFGLSDADLSVLIAGIRILDGEGNLAA